jgi:hypothetical protein
MKKKILRNITQNPNSQLNRENIILRKALRLAADSDYMVDYYIDMAKTKYQCVTHIKSPFNGTIIF